MSLKSKRNLHTRGVELAKIPDVEIYCRARVNHFMNFSLNGNYIDLIILAILAYFISEAWTYGFWIILVDFISFLASLFIALLSYSYIGNFFKNNFSLSLSLAKAIGFFVAAGLSQTLIGFVLTDLIKKIPYKFWKKPWSNLAAIPPALGQGVIIISFILTLITSLPFAPKLKKDVSESKIGSFLLQNTLFFEAKIKEVFGGLAEDSLTYLTVKEGNSENITLDCPVINLTTDTYSEDKMIGMVNNERTKRGLPALALRSPLTPIAEEYARDLWTRQYFSHYSPEGKDIGDRLTEAGISFQAAGENLALAPTLQTAHTGLMNSPGHKRNILDPEFKNVGIGVIDNSYCGKMFVQIFTD
jgi:uncharacterized membrane protein required for colicin V production